MFFNFSLKILLSHKIKSGFSSSNFVMLCDLSSSVHSPNFATFAKGSSSGGKTFFCGEEKRRIRVIAIGTTQKKSNQKLHESFSSLTGPSAATYFENIFLYLFFSSSLYDLIF
jgi:hypothetical protein